MSSPDYRLELERLAVERGLLLHELAVAQQTANVTPQPGHEIVPSSRSPDVITADLARVDAQIEQTTKDEAIALQETIDLKAVDEELKRLESFKDLGEQLPEMLKQDLPQLNNEKQIPSDIPYFTDQALQAPEAATGLESLIMAGALAAGVLTSRQPEMKVPEAPQPAELALDSSPQPAAPQERNSLETGVYELPAGATFAEQPAAILAVSQQVRMEVDPAIAAVDAKYEQKKNELEGKLTLLQEKFDERHADKSADEKVMLQAKLDKQFEELRAQLEKAQEQERQRALDAQAREQANRNMDDPFRR